MRRIRCILPMIRLRRHFLSSLDAVLQLQYIGMLAARYVSWKCGLIEDVEVMDKVST
jgi:hypothetical protein